MRIWNQEGFSCVQSLFPENLNPNLGNFGYPRQHRPLDPVHHFEEDIYYQSTEQHKLRSFLGLPQGESSKSMFDFNRTG